MFKESILERNLLSLALHNKELAMELTYTAASDLVTFRTSKTGHNIPVINNNGREYALHSVFDPLKEGRRYSDSVVSGGYIVVFGIGAGYHLKPLLNRDDVNSLLVIDRDAGILKSILSEIDLSDILSDPRVIILIDKTAKEISDFLPSNYLPAVFGDFNTINLRSRTDPEKEYFNSIFNSIRDILNTLSDDYTVQTWFGKRWFINSIANLEPAGESVSVLAPRKTICIAAAGPSLEIQLEELVQKRKSSFLISTDTALSSLLKNSIVPDLVISIDCQQISYHHFMAGYPEHIPLVLDLASPPVLSRLSKKTIFFTSGHPFSKYINRNWRKFPYVDTSGGNVTHAAISLSESLGAHTIYIFGADFSYPEGKSYARGTYIYPYFTSKATRINSVENSFFSFLYRNDNITMQKTDYGFRYQTRPMLSYKERLERFSETLSANIIQVDGLGEKINTPVNTQHSSEVSLFAAGNSRTDWRNFLRSYKDRLINLNVPDTPPSNYFSMLEFTDKDIWTTLFPAAAALRKKYKDVEIKSSDILMETRGWALGIINRYLS